MMKSKGFTLPELIATTAIAAILVAVAVPTFRELIATNRLATDTNRFTSMLHFARSEAITSTTIVSMCAGSQGKCSCDNNANCDDKWQQGIIVFTDANANCIIDAGENIKRVAEGSINNVKGLGCLSFNARGAKTLVGKTTISFCSRALPKQNTRQIEIEMGGRVTVIVKDDNC